jgi:hypothetical protein
MKLVKEHINFERGLDPREAMNIGKHSIDKDIIMNTHWEIPLNIINDMFNIIKVDHSYLPDYPILVLKTKTINKMQY